MMKVWKWVDWYCVYMCCYDWIHVWMIMNMYVWGYANDDNVKAWFLFMIYDEFVVKVIDEIAMDCAKISFVYANMNHYQIHF